ncbi:MAG: hypothetical protein FWD70_05460 [Desulfuromonadales bacterium]|nr:hypothetical protein [Desulfuromonadales bacterium]
MNKSKLYEEAEVFFAVLFLLIVGALFGWSARSITVKDKLLISTVERQYAERDYYQQQINKMVSEMSTHK